MGYSEDKSKTLRELVAVKKSKDKALALATAEKAAKEKLRASKAAINTNDQADLKKAEANVDTVTDLKETLLNIVGNNDKTSAIEKSCANAKELHAKALEMVKIAHTTALKTVALAEVLEDLNTHLTHETKDTTTILHLLVKDAANALVDAKKTVTLATKALTDSITAASSVCHLNNSLTYAKELLEASKPVVTNKTDGIEELLSNLKDKADKAYEQSLKEKKAADQAVRIATHNFNTATTESNAANAALDAANAALAQVN